MGSLQQLGCLLQVEKVCSSSSSQIHELILLLFLVLLVRFFSPSFIPASASPFLVLLALPLKAVSWWGECF